MLRSLKKEGSREYHAGCRFSINRSRARAHDSALYPERTYSSLARRVHLHLLSHHWTRLLVSLYVLAGRAPWRRPGGALLAYLPWARLHALHAFDVQDVGLRDGHHRGGPPMGA